MLHPRKDLKEVCNHNRVRRVMRDTPYLLPLAQIAVMQAVVVCSRRQEMVGVCRHQESVVCTRLHQESAACSRLSRVNIEAHLPFRLVPAWEVYAHPRLIHKRRHR